MNNIAISRKTDECFTNGKEYECTSAYSKFGKACVDVVCDTGDMITIDINNPDIEIHFINISDNNIKNVPYIKGRYNPEYGDNRICICGHPYGRHFDSYEDMEPCGCKYCGCNKFIANSSAKIKDILLRSKKENDEEK